MTRTTEPLTIRTVICGLDQLDLHSASRVTHVLSGYPIPDFRIRMHSRPMVRMRGRACVFMTRSSRGQSRFFRKPIDVETILSLGRTMAQDLEKGGKPHMLVHCQMGDFAFDRRYGHPASDHSPGQRRGRHLCQAARAAAQRLAELPHGIELADELLQRRGRFTAAAGRLYAAQLAKKPKWPTSCAAMAAEHEVDMALASSGRPVIPASLVGGSGGPAAGRLSDRLC